MNRKWDQRFLGLAHEVATWSKDDVQVGAVVIDDLRIPKGFGYNGIPRNLDDADPFKHQKPQKSWYWEHAERNILYSCARNGISCDDCTMYVTHASCCDCTRAIIQSGIKRLVVDSACLNPHGKFWQKWQHQIEVSKHMLLEAGIAYDFVDLTT